MDQARAINFTVKDDIPIGHKTAIREIESGVTVIKYSAAIGRGIAPVSQGEHLVPERCCTTEIHGQLQAMFDRHTEMINCWKTNDLSESQPTKGNIEGGLTTIEEKALGHREFVLSRLFESA